MRKPMVGISVLLLVVSLSACSNANSGSVNNLNTQGSKEEQHSESEQNAEPEQNSENGSHSEADQTEISADTQLSEYLQEISDTYYPGTAGCSLVAVKYAGEILDWYVETAVSLDVIKKTASTFVEAMKEDSKTEYPKKIDDVYNAALELTKDNAKDALDSAGYEAKSYPWSTESIKEVFQALYEGFGYELPSSIE